MRSPILCLCVLATACGTSTTPIAPPPQPESEPPPETTAPPVATSEPAAPQPAAPEPRIEALARVEAPAEDLVGDTDTARLRNVSLGAHAGAYAAKIRRIEARARRSPRRSRSSAGSIGLGGSAPEAEMAAPSEVLSRADGVGADAGDESVTNTQVAGVDEGGIVKSWGDYLVVLRRGRLFTARLGDRLGAATPVAAIDVRPPSSDHDAWYDEMLVHAPTGTVVVVGFSYEHSATEIARFRIAPDGTLTHRATDLLRSNDYYSSRNYASRLIGDTLVFYMPHYVIDMEWPVRISTPSVRPLRGGGWRSIIDASEIYAIAGDRFAMTLHTVVQCDLAAPRLRCTARGLLGGYGRSFYVSRNAVYVWVAPAVDEWSDGYSDNTEETTSPARLFRLPLDGSRPSVLDVRGMPIDQFSFHETDEDLFVLVRPGDGGGDAMWAPELTAGSVGLARIPIAGFGPNVRALLPAAYRTLPPPSTTAHAAMQNRFIGDYVLYGVGTTWGARRAPEQWDRVLLHRYTDGHTYALTLPNGVDRIEPMASDAVVIGTDGASLHFRAFALDDAPVARGHYVRHGVTQGETRSHGFFYRPTGDREGMLGLPTRSAAQTGAHQLVHGSAEVLYLGVDDLAFTELGALASSPSPADDRCEVSCVDWYGNARPLFYRGRVFALLGYELVEGAIDDRRIREVARTSLLTALGDATPPG